MAAVDARHELDRHEARSWLADQLLEPTKLVFAIVIAESLLEYRVVVTSPYHHRHYIALFALFGIYLTTVMSWRAWHAAHLTTPYRVNQDGSLPRTEIWRFYADLCIVIAYAYTLFQVAPLVEDPAHNIVYLLIGYPIIVLLYWAETLLRYKSYDRDSRRTVPVVITLCLHILVAVIYVHWRHSLGASAQLQRDLLRLNAGALLAALVVMAVYRRFNEYYKRKLLEPSSFFARLPF